MNIDEIFARKRVVFSFEVFPPKSTTPIESIYRTIDSLTGLEPDFISVTYGAGGSGAMDATADIAALIKSRGIEPLAHLSCLYHSAAQIDAVAQKLKEMGLTNILALRGDRRPDMQPVGEFSHADELIAYLHKKGGFHLSAACYPEAHPESRNLDEDVRYLKRKVEAGAAHLVSQLFFDNNDFYAMLDKARNHGITVPIEAGIMPILNKKQIERIVSNCGASLPKKYVKMLNRFEHDPAALSDASMSYAVEQIVDLISNGVDGIHLYTMNRPEVAQHIYGSVKNILQYENSRG